MSFAMQNLAPIVSGTGLIAIDEHSSKSCMIHDETPNGLTLTLLDGSEVPATFVLTIGTEMRVCRVLRRHEEEIEAAFAELGVADHAVANPMRAARLRLGQGRRFSSDFGERRAA